MSKGLSDVSPDAPEPSTLEDESMSTAQERIPVPLFAGEVKVAGRIWSPIYGERTQPAKNERPSGKK